jgi:hypothetical protein
MVYLYIHEAKEVGVGLKGLKLSLNAHPGYFWHYSEEKQKTERFILGTPVIYTNQGTILNLAHAFLLWDPCSF